MHVILPERKAKRQVRFHVIVEDAKALGVNRNTLYRLLTGQWSGLKTLRRRYDALKARQAEGASK